MSPLEAQQCAWQAAMYQNENVSVGMRLYQRNFIGNHGQALALSYPRTLRLLGEKNFRYCAQRYLWEHPIRSGDLNDYGEWFYQIVAEEMAEQIPFVADLARWEWALLRCQLSADVATTISVDEVHLLTTAHVCLLPCCQVLALDYPVHTLSTVHDIHAQLTLPQAACHLLLWQHDNDVYSHELSAADTAFINAVISTGNVEQALDTCLQRYENFTPRAILQLLLQQRLLTFYEK